MAEGSKMWTISLLTIMTLTLLSAGPIDVPDDIKKVDVEADNDGMHSHDEKARGEKIFSHNHFDMEDINVSGNVSGGDVSIGHEVNIDVEGHTHGHHHHDMCDGTWEYGVEYPGNDIRSCSDNKRSTPEACQRLCQSVSGCVGWEWCRDTHNCCVKSNLRNRATGVTGRVAGRRNSCKPGEKSHHHHQSEIQEIKDEMMNMKRIIDTLKDENHKIKDLVKVSVLRSCAEYSRHGLKENGLYMIDPDGKGQGQEAFQVFCNFTSGATEVMHSAEKNGPIQIVHPCFGSGCYHNDISYINGLTAEPISINQISSLIDLAQRCEQQIRFDCKLFAPNDAWWVGRQGEEHTYLTGDHSGCDCPTEDPSCNDRTGWFYGNITDMSALPVMKMYFGGFGNEKGVAFHFSRLKCYGERDVKTAISCSSLKKKGVMTSGYYYIKPEGNKHAQLVFCDMKSDTYTNVPQVEEVSDSSPLGTIMAWVPKPQNALAISFQIPDGWLPCDGTAITKGPWAGGLTPDLNSGRFLRGSSEVDTLEIEEDQVQDHEHEDSGHSHACSASSTAGDHRHNYDKAENSWKAGDFCGAGEGCNNPDSLGYTQTPTDSQSISISTTCTTDSETSGIGTVASSYRSGSETRPKNMKVNYVIRCW